MRTVITHFYNEEYLLPWWLEHHKKYFDFGLMIDYNSTDNSVAIIKEICPNWQIIPSGNQYMDAKQCDWEVMFFERQIPDWRITLTTTEFLVGDLDKLMPENAGRTQWIIPGIRFTKWDPCGQLDRNKPLWEQVRTGISYYDNPIAHQARSLHNFTDIQYDIGRHFWPYTTEDARIFHYANAIVGSPMIKRRLQIQHKISPQDRVLGLGNHHYVDDNGLTFNELYVMHKNFIAQNETDCSHLIDPLMKFL